MDHRTPPMDHAWVVGELTSLSTVVGVLIGVLPTVATIFAILWYGVMIYDRFWGNPPATFGEYHDGHSHDELYNPERPGIGHNSDRNSGGDSHSPK